MSQFDQTGMPESVLTDAVMTLLHGSELAVAVFDDQDILRFANESFVRMFHHRPDGHSTWRDLMRSNHEQQRGSVVNDTADFEAWLASAHSRRGQQAFRAFEGDLIDGRWIWMTETTLATGWMLSVAADITEFHQDARSLRKVRDRALKAAQIDALTGISNRTFVMRRCEQLLQSPGPLALAVFDLDHFKRINDRYGHPAGDAVIRDFARHLQAGTPRRLLRPCGRRGIHVGAARLRTGASAHHHRAPDAARAPFNAGAAGAARALQRERGPGAAQAGRGCDALYQAKREGRDRLVCARTAA